MAEKKWWAKILRVLGIVLMGITAVFTLMAGIGTSCVAFAAEKFGPNMAPIAPFSWLYILFVVLTTAIGVLMVRALVNLIKMKPGSFRDVVISLVLGILIGAVHMAVSRALRGKSMPTDGVVAITVLTLIVFFIFRIPVIWKELRLEKHEPDDVNRLAAASMLILCGAAVLTAPLWGGATHTFIPGGMNWANAWPVQMNLAGSALVLGGLVAFGWGVILRLLIALRRLVLRPGEKQA